MSRPGTPSGVAARDAVLARLKARDRLTGEYPVVLSDQAAQAAREAHQAFVEAETEVEVKSSEENKARLEQCERAWETAKARLAEETITLRFVGLPRVLFRALLDEHKPADDATEAWGEGFPNALIAATCVDPGFDSVEQAAAYMTGSDATLSETEADHVFATALSTCVGARGGDVGKGSGETAS